MRDKITISCSINKDVAKWLRHRAKEWHCSVSWLVEQLLYASMIKSGVLPDADKQTYSEH